MSNFLSVCPYLLTMYQIIFNIYQTRYGHTVKNYPVNKNDQRSQINVQKLMHVLKDIIFSTFSNKILKGFVSFQFN